MSRTRAVPAPSAFRSKPRSQAAGAKAKRLPPASPVESPPGAQAVERFLLPRVSWETYNRLVDELSPWPSLRMTFDGENLELMTVSSTHENFKELLGKLITFLAFELSIAIKGGGAPTIKRERDRRGLEPDSCFWIQSELAVRGKKAIDWDRDPPPDLAVEIDITRSWLDRHGIYLRLGVPEIWAYDGESLRVYLRRKSGKYTESGKSRAFPFLPMAEFAAWLTIPEGSDDTSHLKRFVEWVRGKHFRPAKCR